MQLEPAVQGKATVADVAREGLDSAVQLHVYLQVAGGLESLVAEGAAVRAVGRVVVVLV